ncbi:class I SAM-dependent methyltransferase [Aeoliella sp. SH292]|uniref:class I SAM-dependent methyltransferase n=1 Tax=Aeoliella sp. SH292 TaxID=3454464 RepID=UPI003F994CBA
MRVRDSGMPEEEFWESLFDVPLILDRLGINHLGTGRFHDVAELGCGYGTFTVPIAQAITGKLYTFDIDPAMLVRTRERGQGLSIECQERDVVQHGFGVEVDAVLLFNILHCESPVDLLRHAAGALRPGGEVLIIHWQHGETPRGPSLDIRPRPKQIAEWATVAGLATASEPIDLPPWHYGMVCKHEG